MIQVNPTDRLSAKSVYPSGTAQQGCEQWLDHCWSRAQCSEIINPWCHGCQQTDHRSLYGVFKILVANNRSSQYGMYSREPCLIKTFMYRSQELLDCCCEVLYTKFKSCQKKTCRPLYRMSFETWASQPWAMFGCRRWADMGKKPSANNPYRKKSPEIP